MQRIVSSIVAGLALLVLSSDTASAQGKPAMTVKTATSRKTVYLSGAHPHTDNRITVLWNSATPPQAIYYRPDAARWLKCRVTFSEQRAFGEPGNYMVVDKNRALEGFKKGESYNLLPEEYPSEVQPDEVRKMPAGAIFYQLKGSKAWKTVKVTLTKLPDVKHP